MAVQISFAGCGGMYHYYLGIAKVIQDNFELDNIIFGGTSGGCFPGLLLLLGHDIDAVHYTLNQAILQEASEYWLGSLFRYNYIMRKHISDLLTDVDHEKLKDRYYISVTNLNTKSNEVISSWTSKDDLIHCIQCSCFIPMLFEPYLWYSHRGQRYIDGGVTNNMVKSLDSNGNEIPLIYITPSTWRQVNFNWLYCYSDIHWAEELYKWGKEDASTHLEEFALLKKARKICDT